MTVRNYQKGGPSGRGKSSKSYTFKVSDKDEEGNKRARGFAVRCGHNDDRGICAVAQSLVNTANFRLKRAGEEDDESLSAKRDKEAYERFASGKRSKLGRKGRRHVRKSSGK